VIAFLGEMDARLRGHDGVKMSKLLNAWDRGKAMAGAILGT